jgi:hypothetical protein
MLSDKQNTTSRSASQAAKFEDGRVEPLPQFRD